MLHNALNAMKARRLNSGKYADGQGLWLIKRNYVQGKWIVRLTIDGKRREMGLGPFPDVQLAEARERAATARRKVRDGIDPIAERQSEKLLSNRLSVEEAINGCLEARKAELKNDGAAGRWLSPLSVHVIPKIGNTAIEDVDQHVLLSVLKPIWHTKADTARKAINRLNLTMQHSAALGLDVDLQATLKAKALLGKSKHVPKHFPSMPYADVPTYYQQLCQQTFITALALRFLIVTAARSGEVRFASFSEIEDDVWTIPAERTKTKKEHRIPLTDEALRIIEEAGRLGATDHLFPSPTGKVLSDAAMSVFMKRERLKARPHGFRSTFRTWAENETDADWETKEMCLGHTVGSKVERAYQRSDLLEKRRKLLLNWSNFLLVAN